MWPWIVGGVGGAGAACVAYGVLIEHEWYRMRTYRLAILPPASPPLSILHLSDLHFVAKDPKKSEFLAQLPRADVSVVTGDILGEAEAVEHAVTSLTPTRGRLASYFVLGSNDYFRPQPLNYLKYFRRHGPRRKRLPRGRAPDLVSALEADGWRHLKNLRDEVDLGGIPVELAGIDDPHIHRGDIRPAVREATDRFGLAVVHSPDPAPELAALGYDLIVAGHTHGGQVRLPGVGALVTNSHMPRRFASGLLGFGGSYVHISQGIGTSKYAPFRFLCRPEATMLELTARAPATDGEPDRRAVAAAGSA